MSVKTLSEILSYRQNKEFYTELEKTKMKEAFREKLKSELKNISSSLVKFIDKINED